MINAGLKFEYNTHISLNMHTACSFHRIVYAQKFDNKSFDETTFKYDNAPKIVHVYCIFYDNSCMISPSD